MAGGPGGSLNPDYPSEVNEFRNTIRGVLGEPLSREIRNGPEVIRILALDVSPSMHAMLRNKEIQKEIGEITQELTITHFAGVDDRLLAMEKTNEENIDWFIDQSQATHTHLGSAAKALRKSTSELFFLTDSEGFSSLGPKAYDMWRFVSRFHQLKSEGAILARIP
jgi:hypothetical protein